MIIRKHSALRTLRFPFASLAVPFFTAKYAKGNRKVRKATLPRNFIITIRPLNSVQRYWPDSPQLFRVCYFFLRVQHLMKFAAGI